ncbi:MAG: SpiroCoCo family coiled-coil protein, partial [Exilispira sp.]
KKFDLFCQRFQEESNNRLKNYFENIIKELTLQKEKIIEEYNEFSNKIKSETERLSNENVEKIEIFFNNSIQRITPKQNEIEKRIDLLFDNIKEIDKKYESLSIEMENSINEYKEDLYKRKEEIFTILDKFEKNLEQVKMDYIKSINDINKRTEDNAYNIQNSFENKAKELLEELKIKYIDTASENLKIIDSRYKELDEKKDQFNEMIKNLQNIVDVRVTKILIDKEKDMNEIINRSRENLKSSIESVLSSKDMLLEDFKGDLLNIRNKSNQIFNSIEDEVKAKFEAIEARIKIFNDELNKLEDKNSYLIQIKNEINQIDKLIKDYEQQIEVLNSRQKETEEFLKNFEGIDKDLEEYSKKIFELRNERKTLARLEETFDRLVVLSAKADNQFNKVQNDMEVIENIKNKMVELDQMFKKISEKFGLLKQYDIKLTELNDNIYRLENEIKIMTGDSEGIKELVNSIKVESKTLQEKLLNIEKEILSIEKESRKFDSALEKFSQMDGFIMDLEERNKQLEQKQIWLTKTEDRLEKLNSKSEELIEQLELLIEKSNVMLKMKSEAKRTPSNFDEKSETILELYRQGWSEEEIARVTNKSIAEVELTIKLYGQKK